MTVLRNGAEGQPAGTTLTVAKSAGGSGDAFNAVNGSIQYVNAPGSRPGSSRCYATTTGSSFVSWLNYSWTNAAIRCYYYLTAYPTSSGIIMNLDRVSNGQGMRVGINTAGRIIVQNAIGQTNTANALGQWPLDMWVRLEAQANVGTTTANATMRVQAFEGESTTPFYTYANEGGANLANAPIATPRAGRFSGAFNDFKWDDIEVRDSIEPIGPVPAISNKGWRTWNGTTESTLPEPAGVWNGTALVPVTYTIA